MKTFVLFTLCLTLLLKFSYCLDIVKRCGDKFILNDKAFYFTGSNTYYLHYRDTQNKADEVFGICEKHGFNVLRVWGFMDKAFEQLDVYFTEFNNVTREIDVNEDENGLQRLDQVIASAEQHGVRLIIPFTNNWEAFGGMEEWVRNFGYDKHDDFYTVPEIKKSFKKYINTIINRTNTVTGKKYKEDGTIFSWELANEPRAWGNGFPIEKPYSTDIISNWIDEMSSYIKELDSNHMVSTGEEGFGLAGVDTDNDIYAFDDGNDFKRNAALKNIDFATIHLYPGYWGFKDFIQEGIQYIVSHADVVKKELNKPIIMEEFGLSVDKREEVLPVYMQTMIDHDFNGIMYWMLADDEYPDYDGFTIYDKNITHFIDPFTEMQKKKSKTTVVCKKTVVCKSQL